MAQEKKTARGMNDKAGFKDPAFCWDYYKPYIVKTLKPLIYLAGGPGLEPGAFGSGDQRSIQLS